MCAGRGAPGTARLVVVREGEGRLEVQHTGRCADHPSYEEYERRQAERRAAEDAHRAAERAAEEKRARRRAATAEKRRAAQAAKEQALAEAAE
ncbi:hypothetical protein ACFW9F_29885, partial [Streptomyces sp. NPDC059506]|uniref:hypothetical protein n=1 Tax=Streptomyces sp. NPDC059506 TaxID=3347751 RepID=UPI003682BA47